MRSKVSVAPSIDWSAIRVHRLMEGQADRVIQVNLEEKMKEWDQGGREGKPFDLELERGDRVELMLKDGALNKPSELVEAYFRKGLALPVTLKVLDSKGVPGPLMSGNLEYEAPKWVESMRQVVPLYLDATRGEIDEVLDGLITIQVTREGGPVEGVRIRRNHYFPRAGDQIWSERNWGDVSPPTKSSAPGGPSSSQTKKGPRVRYVPQPAK